MTNTHMLFIRNDTKSDLSGADENFCWRGKWKHYIGILEQVSVYSQSLKESSFIGTWKMQISHLNSAITHLECLHRLSVVRFYGLEIVNLKFKII